MELTNICRTCFKTNFETEDIYNIKKVGSVDFVQVLLECTSVQVTKSDILPQRICVMCIKYIKNYYKFRQKCIESQKKLLQYFKNLHNNFESISTRKIIQKSKNPITTLTDYEFHIKSNPENVNNNKYSEFVDIQKYKIENSDNTNNKLFSNNQIAFRTDDIKTEIKSEPEDENIKDNNEGNNETDEETFSEDEFFKFEDIKKKDLTCISCNEKFISEFNLKKHIRQVHDKGYRYLCHICPKLTKCRSTWRYHIMTHRPESERNFVCAKCNKRFISSTLYKRHISSVHTEAKQYTCHLCPARFKQKFGCVKHINSVHSDKTYSCNFCHKRFNREDNLKQHVKIHTGERPHKCEICGKDFLYIHVLRSHLKTHKINK